MPYKTPLLAILLMAWPTLAQAQEGYAGLLARYDRNGNGVLEPHERAALFVPAPSESLRPLVCEAEATGTAGGAAASAKEELAAERVNARIVRVGHEQLAAADPDAENSRAANEADAESVDGYSASPSPTDSRPLAQGRTMSTYHLQTQAAPPPQPRSQPFARAATFGAMVGRTKRYQRAAIHDTCAPSRHSFYLARY